MTRTALVVVMCVTGGLAQGSLDEEIGKRLSEMRRRGYAHADAVALASAHLKWILSRCPERKWDVGFANFVLGWALLEANRLDEARVFFERAEATYPQASDGEDRAGDLRAWIDLHNGFARVFAKQGKYAKAEERYRTAAKLADEGRLRNARALTLRRLGSMLIDGGDYERARAALRDAERSAVALERIRVVHQLGRLYHRQGQYSEATLQYRRALQPVVKAIPNLKDSGLEAARLEEASLRNDLGMVYVALGQMEDAEPQLALSKKLRLDLHPEWKALLATKVADKADYKIPYAHRIAQSLVNYHYVYKAGHEYDKALDFAQRSFDIRKASLGETNEETARSALALATLFLELEQPDQAIEYIDIGRRTWARGSKSNPRLIDVFGREARAWHLKGDAKRTRERLEKAIAIARETLIVSGEKHTRAARLASSHYLRGTLGIWLDVCEDLGADTYDRVLAFKALASRIDEGMFRARRAMGGARWNKWSRLKQRLGRVLHSRPEGGSEDSDARIGEINDEIRRIESEVGGAAEVLKEARQRLALRVRDLGIQPSDRLIDFYRTKSHYYAWVVGTEVHGVRLAASSDIDEAVQKLRDAIATQASARHESMRRALARVKDLVWTPLVPFIPESTRRIQIVPDGALAALPFGALPGSRHGVVLMQQHVLSFLTAAQDMVPWLDSADRATSDLLIVSGIDYGKPLQMPGWRWRSLPDADRAAEWLVARCEDAGRRAVNLGPKATQADLEEHAPGHRWIHFHTHGFLSWPAASRHTNPTLELELGTVDPLQRAGLALFGANELDSVARDKGVLTASEASFLDLTHTELVTLGACDSAGGVGVSGEGVLGLVRGFRLAGARSVVATLWPVDNTATRFQTLGFYNRLLKGDGDMATAIRDAALAVRQTGGYNAPIFWASLVFYGPLR